MSFLLSMNNLNIAQVCGVMAYANVHSTEKLVNNVKDRNDTTDLILTKVMVGACFTGTLVGPHIILGSKKISPIVVVAPIIIPMVTLALAQIAKKAEKYEEAFATFDKYCDRILETASSIVSVACLVWYAKQVNRSVSYGNLAITVGALALATIGVAYKVFYLVRSYNRTLPPQPLTLEEFYKKKGIKIGNEPVVIDNREALGLDLTAVSQVRTFTGKEDATGQFELFTKNDVLNDIVAHSNKEISSMSRNGVQIASRRNIFFLTEKEGQPFYKYDKDGSIRLKNTSLEKVLQALQEKECIHSYKRNENGFWVQF